MPNDINSVAGGAMSSNGPVSTSQALVASVASGEEIRNSELASNKVAATMAARNADVGGGLWRMFRYVLRGVSNIFSSREDTTKKYKVKPIEVLDAAIYDFEKEFPKGERKVCHGVSCYEIMPAKINGIDEKNRTSLRSVANRATKEIKGNSTLTSAQKAEAFGTRAKARFNIFLGTLGDLKPDDFIPPNNLNALDLTNQRIKVNMHRRDDKNLNLRNSISDFDRAIKHNSTDPYVYFYRGLAQLYKPFSNKAACKHFFEEALKHGGNLPMFNHFAGIAAGVHYAEARRYFQQELEHNPNPQTYKQLGFLETIEAESRSNKAPKISQLKQARAYLRKALEYDNNLELVHFYLGRSYLEAERYEEALEHFKKEEEENIKQNAAKKIAFFPKHIVREYIAHTYLRMKQADNALEIFNELVSEEPGHKLRYVNRAKAYKALGKIEEAEQDLREAVKVSVNRGIDEYGSRRDLAWFLLKEDGLNIFLDNIDYKITQNPENPDLLIERAVTLFEYSKTKKDFNEKFSKQEQSLKDLDKASTLNADLYFVNQVKSLIYKNQGRYFESQGNTELASKSYESSKEEAQKESEIKSRLKQEKEDNHKKEVEEKKEGRSRSGRGRDPDSRVSKTQYNALKRRESTSIEP